MVTKVRGASSQDFPSIAAIKAYDAPVGSVLYLNDGGRSGEGTVKAGTPPSDPQEGIYIVLNNGNYWERIYSGKINVEWFGAVGDYDEDAGTGTDNTVPIQAVMDFIDQADPRSGIVFFPKGDYKITSMLTGNTDPGSITYQMRFLGETATSRSFTHSNLILISTTAEAMLKVDSGFSAENIGFSYPDSRTNNSLVSPKYLVICDNFTDVVDVDAYFINCRLTYFHRAIKLNGRGLFVEGCMFALGSSASTEGACVDIELLGDSGTFTPGEFIDQVRTEAFRGITIRNSKVHAVTGTLLRNKSADSNLVKGIHITGNYSDTSISVIDGDIRDAVVTGNTFLNSNANMFDLASMNVCDNLTVAGNIFSSIRQESVGQLYANGSAVTQSEVTGALMTTLISSTPAVTNSSFTGNVISGVARDVFTLVGGIDRLTISGNTFKNVGAENVEASGAFRKIINPSTGNINQLHVFGNTFENDAGWPRTTNLLSPPSGTLTNYEFGNNFFSGKVDYDATLRHEDYDFGGDSSSIICGSYVGEGATTNATKAVFKRGAKAATVTQVTGTAAGATHAAIDGNAGTFPDVRCQGNSLYAANDFNLGGETYIYVIYF